MACWGLIPRFWVKDKGFKEDDAVWGEQKLAPGKLCFKFEAILSVKLFHKCVIKYEPKGHLRLHTVNSCLFKVS